MKSQIFEGRLIDVELKQLQDLLQAPDLLNAKSFALPQQASIVSREFAMTSVSIARGNEVQTVFTARFVGFQNGFETRDAALGDARPLEPFLVWTKILESRRLAPLPDAVPNDCALSQH
jgi:hypothetical protein